MDRTEFVEFLASIESNPVCKSWIYVLNACEPDDDRLSVREVMIESDSRGYLMEYDGDHEGEWYICHPYFVGQSVVKYYKLDDSCSFELQNTSFDKFVSRIRYTLSNECIESAKKRIDMESKKADNTNTQTKPAWVL